MLDHRRKKGKQYSIRLYADIEHSLARFMKKDRRKLAPAIDILLEEGLKSLRFWNKSMVRKTPKIRKKHYSHAHSVREQKQ